MILDSIAFNMSRNILQYLYDNNHVNEADIQQIPFNCIKNIYEFLKELRNKYNYKLPDDMWKSTTKSIYCSPNHGSYGNHGNHTNHNNYKYNPHSSSNKSVRFSNLFKKHGESDTNTNWRIKK